MSWLRDSLRDFWRRGDKLLLALCLAASAYGLILIYSATRYLTVDRNRSVLIQTIGILLGVVVYILLSSVDVELFVERSWKLLLLFDIGFNLLVRTPLGVSAGGNLSWIRFPGLPMNIQPAEVTKLTFILLFAWQCTRLQKKGISKISSVFQLVAHTLMTAGVIAVASGDYGMTLVYLFLFVVMCWCAGVQLRWFALAAAVIVVGVVVVWPHISDQYFAKRITVVIDHITGNQATLDSQTQGVGWQQTRSILAIGSGGLFGRGYLQGIQTQSPYETSLNARSTDEIFAVCGEELGLVGCTVIILLLGAIIARCVWVARQAPSSMTALTAMGYAGMLLFQSVLNIGMCLYVLPIVGLTLPFFSYGGSSIITMFAAMGVVSSVKTRSLPSWLRDRSSFS
ncbi:MAG: FtsW/RodA/SpoVE family cell cycle protein [Oscillospiraceae bacterium]|nr:FtsW/RodA/SpoVE family cell cycle protein [Oscillospiraceae bacterium]